MKKNLILLVLVAFTLSLNVVAQKRFEKLPDNPSVGKCYVKCTGEDTWETREVRVLVKPAYKKLTRVPAKYNTVEERVMIKPETKKIVYVPPVFGTRDVRVMTEEPVTRLKINPARFSASTERVLVKPKSAHWDYKKTPDCQAADPDDCLTACWVESPAEYKNVPISKLVSDASTSVSSQGQPKYITVRTQVVTKPATTRTVVIPAQYRTIRKRVLEKDETTRVVNVPAEYKTERVRVLKEKASKPYWVEVDCGLLDYSVIPIYYPLNSARLTAEARRVIDNTVYKVLRENPDIKIELASHTDSRGNANSNLVLSRNRAQSVVNYLISKGIKKNRMVANGYGEDRLVNKCSDGVNCSEKEHQQNRRTEFRVLNR